MPPSLLRLLLGVGLFLGERADVIDQVPALRWAEAVSGAGHIALTLGDDVEEFAIGITFGDAHLFNEIG